METKKLKLTDESFTANELKTETNTPIIKIQQKQQRLSTESRDEYEDDDDSETGELEIVESNANQMEASTEAVSAKNIESIDETPSSPPSLTFQEKNASLDEPFTERNLIFYFKFSYKSEKSKIILVYFNSETYGDSIRKSYTTSRIEIGRNSV